MAMTVPRPSKVGNLFRKAVAPVSILGWRAQTGNSSTVSLDIMIVGSLSVMQFVEYKLVIALKKWLCRKTLTSILKADKKWIVIKFLCTNHVNSGSNNQVKLKTKCRKNFNFDNKICFNFVDLKQNPKTSNKNWEILS